MESLITVIPASEVTEDYKKEASKWDKWDSKTRKKFPYKYLTEERVLMLSGSATLTPDDGSPAVTIKEGDAVTFHVGFKCKWLVTKRIKKHYAVFSNTVEGDEGEEAPSITCDVCDAGCVTESYFFAKDESDICPSCYAKDEEKYPGAVYQKNGEDWIEKEPPKKRPKKTLK